MTLAIILLAVGALAYANGANDNFKGVATLYGSGTSEYRSALAWATATTLLGSLTAIFLAAQLIKAFKGKGLVDATPVADPKYVAAVAVGAALTVLFATKFGMPVRTTHAMIGALIGKGLAASATINIVVLNEKLLLPLLSSPVIAIGGLFNARRVAETMSRKMTPLNHGQGFTANALAGLIVIGASRFGMPVSTTHVTCGALFGIGTLAGTARWRTIGTILIAWVTTLPLGGLLGYAAFRMISERHYWAARCTLGGSQSRGS